MNEILEPRFSAPIAPVKEKVSEVNKLLREKVHILWTGGFDSTYRIIQLSRLDVDIQPYYLIDERFSEHLEIKAIKEITADIINHPETKCNFLPLIKSKVSDIEPDESVTEAYHRLYAGCKLGIQYDWLGRFAQMIPGLEISLEKSISSKAYSCIEKYGKLIQIENSLTSYYVADKNNSNADFVKVMGNFRFPRELLNLTKLQMAELYRDYGFEHVLQKTWFCHTPVRNKPCGVCNPCKSVVEEGLSFRISNSGMKWYRFSLKFGTTKWFIHCFKIYRFIVNLAYRT